MFSPDAECRIGFRKKIADIKQASNLASHCNIFLYDAVRCTGKKDVSDPRIQYYIEYITIGNLQREAVGMYRRGEEGCPV